MSLGSGLPFTTSNYSSSLFASINKKCKFPSEAESDRITSGMRYFGLFSSEKATIRGGNLLDTLCGQLEKLLSFQPGERDLVMLQHKFVVEWKDGKKVSGASCWISCQNRGTLSTFSTHVSALYIQARPSRTPGTFWPFSLFFDFIESSRIGP